MSEDDDILAAFFSEAEEWAEQFVGFALEVTQSDDVAEDIKEIFRGVHSLKGGAGFLVASDARLGSLGDFCHKFETFLDKVRNGEIAVDQTLKEMIAEGLNMLADDIKSLVEGKKIEEHEEYLKRCQAKYEQGVDAFQNETAIARVVKEGNRLIFHLTVPIRTVGEVGVFEALLREYVFKEGGTADVFIELKGQSVIPSLAIGSIIGIKAYTNSITIVGMSSNVTIERFGLKNMGINFEEKLPTA